MEQWNPILLWAAVQNEFVCVMPCATPSSPEYKNNYQFWVMEQWNPILLWTAVQNEFVCLMPCAIQPPHLNTRTIMKLKELYILLTAVQNSFIS